MHRLLLSLPCTSTANGLASHRCRLLRRCLLLCRRCLLLLLLRGLRSGPQLLQPFVVQHPLGGGQEAAEGSKQGVTLAAAFLPEHGHHHVQQGCHLPVGEVAFEGSHDSRAPILRRGARGQGWACGQQHIGGVASPKQQRIWGGRMGVVHSGREK